MITTISDIFLCSFPLFIIRRLEYKTTRICFKTPRSDPLALFRNVEPSSLNSNPKLLFWLCLLTSLSDSLLKLNWQMLTLLHKICTPISLLGIPFFLLFLWSMHCQERQSSTGPESPCTLLLSVPNFKDNATYHMHSIHLGSLLLPVGLEGRGTGCFFHVL